MKDSSNLSKGQHSSRLSNQHAAEVRAGKRFAFGRNWQRFLNVLNDRRIDCAESSLRETLDVESLRGRRFLDVGCGSGLFSLAAMRLEAAHVHSFDYDPESVTCARKVKQRFFPEASNWTIEEGSILDHEYLARLGRWDVVYSWGVLHHTGAMWQALDNIVGLPGPSGLLFVSIYNDQGWKSAAWTKVKAFYNSGPLRRGLVVTVFVPWFAGTALASDLLHSRNPLARYRDVKRGMSVVRDWFDWLGGYPFEVATPQQLVDSLEGHGFTIKRLTSRAPGLGCNEVVCQRS